MTNPQRYERFLEELPRHNGVITKAALASGFSKSTSNTQQKRIMQTAVKYQAKKLLRQVEDNMPSVVMKKTMSEIVGISQERLMERLKYIANQDKDLSSALKVLAPLAKEHGITLQQDEKATMVVPTLNLILKGKEDILGRDNTALEKT